MKKDPNNHNERSKIDTKEKEDRQDKEQYNVREDGSFTVRTDLHTLDPAGNGKMAAKLGIILLENGSDNQRKY